MQKKSVPPLYLLFGFFIGIIGAAVAQSVKPMVHIASKPGWISPYKSYNKKPSARDIEDGAYYDLIEEQVNVEEKATYNHFITQIVSESGVQNNSEISVSFDPSYERLDFHEITVWRNNKPQSRLNADAFKMLAEEDELDKFIYNGTYSAKYILSDIRKGDRIEYSYTITGRNPILNNKFCRSIYLQGSALIVHQYTTLLFSGNRKIDIKSFNLRSQPKIAVVGGLKRYEWEDFQVPGVLTHKQEPKWVNNFARVQVSDYGTWADVISWGLKINPLQVKFTGELADTIAKFKRQSGTAKEKYFRDAVTFVQDEIRYMGIEIGQYSHKANTPEKVFKQRYGDCKDKSLLLASILNAGGIEAHMVLLNTDLGEKVEEFLPSATLFDHAVVVAVVNGKQVWVDATMANQGGKGTELYFPAYGAGLILKAGNTGLTKIQETKTGKITCEEKFNISDEYSPVKFAVTTNYTFNQADEIRDRIASSGVAETEKNYLGYYSKTYGKIEAADSIIIKDNKEKNEFTTIERYTIPDFFKHDSLTKKYTADFYADFIAEQLPDVPGQMKTPVSINYPYAIDYTINIIMANGWDIENEHTEINRDAYKFISDKTVSDNKLSLHYQFAYFKDHIPVNKLAEFRQDVKDLKDNKLWYSFFYIPDIKATPFKINRLMVLITIIVIGIFIFAGLKVYKTQTSDSSYYTRNSFPPAIGGWLVVLIIVLFATALGIINNLVQDDYYSTSKWDLFSTGINSIISRTLLIFELAGYLVTICYSVFCIVLILNKRDISVRFIKGYYIFVVAFLFVDYTTNAIIKHQFLEYDMEQIVKAVVLAALWTYYLNTSNRVKETFTVPYPN